MNRTRLFAGSALLLLSLLLAVPALAAAPTHFQGKIGGRAALDFYAKTNAKGVVKKVEKFVWDGLKCGHDVFTGGATKSIPVKRGSFRSSQRVNVGRLTLHVRGKFNKAYTKASGTLKITGECSTGKKPKPWSARS